MFEANAQITSTNLGFHDGVGSIPTANIGLSGAGWGQGFGGYCLKGDAAYGFIYGVLNALECESWEKLKGSHVRIRRESEFGDRILAIGHILKDQWFDPSTLKGGR